MRCRLVCGLSNASSQGSKNLTEYNAQIPANCITSGMVDR